MKFIDIGECIIIHDKMIEVGGGRPGVADYRLLHSSVERPKATFAGKSLYPTIWLKAAALMHSLVKNHPFNDGNKRSAFFSTMRFLAVNGYELHAKTKDIVEFGVSVDVKNLSLEVIAEWFKKHCFKKRV